MADNDGYAEAERRIAEALCKRATSLDLNDLSLTVLPESLSKLTQLQRLDLAGNRLAALPHWLGKFTNLRDLGLGGNRLAAVPDWLGELAQLQGLGLGGNRLTALPESLGNLTQLQKLSLHDNQLAALPAWLGKLTKLQCLDLRNNRLTALPDGLGKLTKLHRLDLGGNRLAVVPESLGNLVRLQGLDLTHNLLTALPESLGKLAQLQRLDLAGNLLTALPESLGNLTQLQGLGIRSNLLTVLPESLSKLTQLQRLDLAGNPLSPELALAHRDGTAAVKRYLRALAESAVALNEAKLILIGEGEVGKSCLLAALRGDPWEEQRPTTHGIEIKPVQGTDATTGRQIRLKGWDFGGQPVYRPTHQLFFSAPAVYLVVWKPREGPQQGFVREWIKLVLHRAPEAKILVVATHGGPKERQPDIDRQEIWNLFGKDTVIDFLSVESKPDAQGERPTIGKLKDAIARVAAALPEMGRKVPKLWQEVRQALCESTEAYLPVARALALCREHKIEEADARQLLRICHRLGDLIYYEHDPALRNILVLKPDWLATAISYVLDDKQTRERHGLVAFARLGELWKDPSRPEQSRYDASLHPLFLRLMERFDLSYKVAVAGEAADALEFWHRLGDAPAGTLTPPEGFRYTSLIAQLVPDLQPEADVLARVWPERVPEGTGQQVQICQIVEAKTGQSARAEGLFYQLIVRLHKYSLGRLDHHESVHWQHGLVLDDEYNGSALLEYLGNDVRITVRAAYPQGFLAVLAREVKWLVENFWKGLRCDLMVPCVEPCGRKSPGIALFPVQKLIESKRRGRSEYPCPVCDDWQSIDALLTNAPAAQPEPMAAVMARFDNIDAQLKEGFDVTRHEIQAIGSLVDDAFRGMMTALTDEAKDGPRLFSLAPVEPGFLGRPEWINQTFRLTLWCEHSRLPLPLLNKHGHMRGVYELNVPREWFVQAAPILKGFSAVLSLVLPVAAAATKLALDQATYKGIEDQLDFGRECIQSVATGSEMAADGLGEGDRFGRGGAIGHGEAPLDEVKARLMEARGAVLRQIQAWLREKDPSFGGLIRVQNKRHEFLWVHPKFEREY